MSAHAFLAPSSAHIWVRCAAAPGMIAAYPSCDSDASEEGTAAHWLCAERANGVLHQVGDRAPNGVLVDHEMLAASEVWMQALRPLLGQEWHVEERLDADPAFSPHVWGTPDLWTLANGILDVFDFKFGHGHVDEYENWQLLAYARLIVGKLPVEPMLRLHIVQPRCFDGSGPHRVWTVPASEVRAHFNRLANAAAEAVRPDPPATAGLHCQHCPGRAHCAANQRAGSHAMSEATRPAGADLPPEALAVELGYARRAADLLKARILALEESAAPLVRAGQLPGYEMQRTRGGSKWLVPPETVAALADSCGVNVRKPLEVMTPNQAIDAGLSEPLVKALFQRTPGAEKIVQQRDGARVFGFTIDKSVNS